MLYKIVHDKSCFDLNPELFAIKEFADCYSNIALVKEEDRDRRFRVVALVADRRSPIRSLPEKRRREQACLISGYGLEGNRPDRNARDIISGKVEVVEKAIIKYRELQYDENEDTLNSVNSLIQSNRNFINSVNTAKEEEKNKREYAKSLEMANKFSEGLPKLIETKQKLEVLLNISHDQKAEIQTYTGSDIESNSAEGSENLSLIDQYWQSQDKLKE